MKDADGFVVLPDWPIVPTIADYVPGTPVAAGVPHVMRGATRDWPIAAAARLGDAALVELLQRYQSGRIAKAFTAPLNTGGRFFYNDTIDGFVFERVDIEIGALLTALGIGIEDRHIYAGSLELGTYFPGLDSEIGQPDWLHEVQAQTYLWIGNASRVAAHFDALHNVATAIAGPRRFILFPPDQISNLYIGPLDFTPAGQPLSLVDFHAPDLEGFPRFAEAMAHAQMVTLQPGDSLYIPPLWWHHVESSASLGVMINRWWPGFPAWADAPMNALRHGLLSIAHLAAPERDAWRRYFDHYVFGPADNAPPIDQAVARRLRATLLNALNR
jgi:hypothetical protein